MPVTKKNLVDRVAEKTVSKKSEVAGIIEAVHNEIRSALAAGEDVRLSGFGTFKLRRNEGRAGRNPRTGEPVQIAASTSVKFKPAKEFGDQLNRR